jgi:hypothetical protein
LIEESSNGAHEYQIERSDMAAQAERPRARVSEQTGHRIRAGRNALTAVFCLALALASADAAAQAPPRDLPPGVERADVLMLPQFCWGYFIGGMRTPDYMIPPSCGPYTNHYCEALLPYNRAKVRGISGPRGETAARDAHRATIGLLQNIKPYPNCPAHIRAYAESILAETSAKLGAAKKPPR